VSEGIRLSWDDFRADPVGHLKSVEQSGVPVHVSDARRSPCFTLGTDPGLAMPPLSDEELADLPQEALSPKHSETTGTTDWLQ
jgi:hypothetical protein